MRWIPALLLAAALLAPASASAAGAAGLADLRQARSRAAEALEILRLEQRGAVTATYARAMEEALADGLRQAGRTAGKAGDPAAPAMLAAADAAGRGDAAALQAALGTLLSMEAARVRHP